MQALHTLLLSVLLIQALFVQGCIEHERDALLKFKAGVTDPSNRLISWSGTECCNWAGIRCRNQTGQVIELHLQNPYSYPEFGGYKHKSLSGKINPSLLSLSGLEYLDLSWNNFGGKVPEFIGKFENLKYLNLSFVGFSGKIPPQLGNLSTLQYLDLSYNYALSASADVSWLSHLQSLRYLDMSEVNLQNSKEWVQSLNKLPSLDVLILDNNRLTHIPQSLPFVNFTSLRVLRLSHQLFNTTIPDWLFSLHSLTDLNLEVSQFVGSFPVALGNLTSLSKLVLGCSALQGKIPPLHNLTKLTYVNLPCILHGEPIDIMEVLSQFSRETRRRLEGLILYDTHLTGNLSGLVGEIPNIKYLDLSMNKLSGPIPDEFWNLTDLVELDLSDNSLTGSLTDTCLDRLSKLKVLSLGRNHLGGKIPSPSYSISYIDLADNRFEQFPDLFDAPKLQELYLSMNRISGTIELALCRFTFLRILDLSSNNISGFHPNCLTDNAKAINHSNNKPSDTALSSLNCSNFLWMLTLDNNSLTGEFPSSLLFCRGLIHLDLGENSFLGEIPQSIGENLSQLTFLRMRSNFFSGKIPTTLTVLSKLRVLDLADNFLSGPLPENLDKFYGMGLMQYHNDVPSDTLFARIEGFDFEYKSLDLELQTSIDLSNNYLTGEIPRNITALLGLVNLNLSHNYLIGKIPAEIGKMRSLESLDLHLNNLSGTIPQSLFALNSLHVVNLSYNNLSGGISTGHRLHGLDSPSIYIGNRYLCGPPLENRCSDNAMNVGGREKRWLYLFIEFVFVIGCLVVVSVLVMVVAALKFKRFKK